jgi:hypothetical protein
MIPMTRIPLTNPTTGISLHLPILINASTAENIFIRLDHQLSAALD